MSKYVLLIALWFVSFILPKEAACLRQISIVHIGIEDVPVPTLIFTTQKTRDKNDSEYKDIIVLDEDEFARVAHLLKTFDSSKFTKLSVKDMGTFGSFKLTVLDSCKQISQNAYNPNRSDNLFRFILKNINCFNSKNQQRIMVELKNRINKQ